MIRDLKRQGLSVPAIARKAGPDRKTVRRHLERGMEAPVCGPRAPRPRRVGPFEDCLVERTAAFPDLSGKRLLREIRGPGHTGCCSIVTGVLRAAQGLRAPVRDPAGPPGAGGFRPVPGGIHR